MEASELLVDRAGVHERGLVIRVACSSEVMPRVIAGAGTGAGAGAGAVGMIGFACSSDVMVCARTELLRMMLGLVLLLVLGLVLLFMLGLCIDCRVVDRSGRT